jgi:magnesium chelatase family protein
VPLARTYSVALIGVHGQVVEVEADIANGLVGMILVGLPDTALREARDRIRAAIVNSGEEWPQRKITVGLSPASLPKRGSWFDLAARAGVFQRKHRGSWTWAWWRRLLDSAAHPASSPSC